MSELGRNTWHVVAVAMAANMLVTGATYSAFGLFVLPVSSEYDLSRANMNTVMILLNVGMASAAPILGRMLDRFPPHRVMLASAVTFGASFACLGLSHSIFLSAVVVVLPLAVAVQGCGSLTMSVLIARRFTAQRGRAMALSVVGMSLGSVVMVPIIGYLIESRGWRSALLAIGLFGGSVLAGMSFLVRPRANEGRVPSDSAQRRTPMRVVSALRMAQFWIIALAFGLALGVTQTLVVSLVPHAQHRGLTVMEATSLVSIMGSAAIAAKLLLAVVADRIEKPLLLFALFIVGAMLNVALLVSDGYMLLMVCAATLGVGVGAVAPLFYAFLADRFGAVSFGTVRGLMVPVTAILSAVGIRLGGEIFDRSGSYDWMFLSFVAAQIVAAMLILATRSMEPQHGLSLADEASEQKMPSRAMRAALESSRARPR